MVMKIRTILDRERARLKGLLTDISDVDTMRDAMDDAREETTRYRAANLIMEGKVRRLAEDLDRERSISTDLWEAYQRVQSQRDFWQREAEVLSERLKDTTALLDAVTQMRGRRLLEQAQAPLRAVKGGAA